MPERGYSPFVTENGPWLVEKPKASPLEEPRPYNPMEYRDLYREFADIDTTAEGVRRFADRYGMLQLPRRSAQSDRIDSHAKL